MDSQPRNKFVQHLWLEALSLMFYMYISQDICPRNKYFTFKSVVKLTASSSAEGNKEPLSSLLIGVFFSPSWLHSTTTLLEQTSVLMASYG